MEAARALEPLPGRIMPMLARLGGLPADEAAYGFEVKWDGIRALGYLEPGRFRLDSRRLRDITATWPEVTAIARRFDSRTAVLDGEIVAFDEDGRPSFERLQSRMHLAGEAAIRRRARELPAVYVVFDLLWLDGRSLMEEAYAERRRRLEDLGLDGPAWRTPGYRRGAGADLLAASREQGLEGVVAKRLDSRYESGRRSGAWIKVKHTRRQELVIGGWLRADMGRSRTLGALLVGHWDVTPEDAAARGAPQRLHYAGKVGIGYSEADRAMLRDRLEPLRRDASPFSGRQPVPNVIFAEPVLVAEIDFHEWTASGMLRHPAFKGLRDDVDARRVLREDRGGSAAAAAAPAQRSEEPPLDREAAHRAPGPAAGEVTVQVDGRALRLTNLRKVLYPRAGVTKAAVLDYYARIGPTLLPHVRGRAMTSSAIPTASRGRTSTTSTAPAGPTGCRRRRCGVTARARRSPSAGSTTWRR